ncbi:MAG TPA: trigger factor [Bacteroidales bacterium]|jgi:trigger factor|nr:trigger factor [Bacteroidales bacterium]MCZ2417166.1 trigger factor [Burkholderiales bacterium]OQC58783.1 MAG: Trigger factor [Bacteroidetes bacterium ADurb.Bin013]MBP8999087.1 trigger factor [Bacteroidales bacterium]MBV6455843.1 Trigger factor [Bacteroidales bacterium]
MNITKKEIDDLSLQVTVSVEENDYSEKVKKALNDTRKKIEIKGFRKGMVPLGIVQKMYGRSILLEQVNTYISEALNAYMEKEAIRIIGEPLVSEEQAKTDWDKDVDFSFSFDLMLAPKVDVPINKDLHIPLIKKNVSEKDVERQLETVLEQQGTLQVAEKVEKEDLLKVDLRQGELLISDSYLNLKNVAKQKDKKPFIGKAVGEEAETDISVLFPKEADRAILLQIKQEELERFTNPVFTFVIKEIKRFEPARENQELYDKLFGPGNVTTHESFLEKIREQIDLNNQSESNYRFGQDVKNILVEKAGLQLPEKLLKRWLFEGNDGKFTMEQIEKDFPAFLEDFRWQLVRETIMKEYGLKVEKDDMAQSAVAMARYQFAMYGMNNVPDEHLIKYAERMLANEKEARNLYERAEENKVISYIRENVTVDIKEE